MHSPLRALAVIGAALVLMIGGAVAYSAIPSANGTIRACYDNGGALKLIDEGASCPKGWKGPVSWNQQGVPGQDAPTFFNSDHYTVQVAPDDVLQGETFGRAFCDPGDPLLTGSALIKQDPALPNMTEDQGGTFGVNASDQLRQGYHAYVLFPVGSTVPGRRIIVTAVCADLPPLRP